MAVNLKGFTDKQLNKRLSSLENSYTIARDWWEQNTIKMAYQDVLDEKQRRIDEMRPSTEELIDEIIDELTPNPWRI